MKKISQISNYRKNIVYNYIFKLFGIVISLVSTRVSIDYLGNSLYGLWVTLASVISWMSSGDFGIGNGLRNKYAEAYAERDVIKQKELIATGMNTLSKISVVLYIVILIISEVLFNVGILQSEVRIPMYITALFLCINLIFGVAHSVAYGQQKSWFVSCAGCGMTFSSVFVIGALSLLKINANLTLFAIVHGVCSTIPNLILIIILRKKGIDILRCGIRKYYRKDLKRDILNVGLIFFGLQICSIILYSTGNVIINYLFNSAMVTKYSVITKVYDSGQGLFSILLISLWSAVTFQATQKNFKWIRTEIRRLLVVWVLYSCGVIAVSILLNWIVKIWIGSNANYYEPSLVWLFAAYGIITSFSAIFVNVINGLGKIKLQLVVAIIGAVLNIPLAVLFARECGMGILGVKLATLVAAVFTALAVPIQVIVLLWKDRIKKKLYQ